MSLPIRARLTLLRIIAHIMFRNHELSEETRASIDDPAAKIATYTCSCGLSTR